MTKSQPDELTLSVAERDLVRREFMSRFGEAPSVMEGFHLKRWVTGPNRGKPKLTAGVQSLLACGLITIIDEGHWPRAMFTAEGLLALKRLASDRRLFDPERHRSLIDELMHIPEL